MGGIYILLIHSNIWYIVIIVFRYVHEIKYGIKVCKQKKNECTFDSPIYIYIYIIYIYIYIYIYI